LNHKYKFKNKLLFSLNIKKSQNTKTFLQSFYNLYSIDSIIEFSKLITLFQQILLNNINNNINNIIQNEVQLQKTKTSEILILLQNNIIKTIELTYIQSFLLFEKYNIDSYSLIYDYIEDHCRSILIDNLYPIYIKLHEKLLFNMKKAYELQFNRTPVSIRIKKSLHNNLLFFMNNFEQEVKKLNQGL
jgi:hypothetical protein